MRRLRRAIPGMVVDWPGWPLALLRVHYGDRRAAGFPGKPFPGGLGCDRAAQTNSGVTAMMRDTNGLRYFHPPIGGLWRPRWDKGWRSWCTVMAARTMDGGWHYFESFVTEAAARWWQASEGVKL